MFELSSIFLYSLEILIKFNTAIHHKGDIIINRKKIANHLIKKGIIWEVVIILLYTASVVLNF